MNIKKSIRDLETLREIFMDLVNDPKDEELLEEVDFYLHQLQLDIYTRN